ncbi:hypothetical protein CW362_38150 [Streptomyces populi]|uniref:Thioesterase domain-containing protein n=1 Tax=Streptomyces populi TaxID=2058924 RepID=A0A2I0SD64_9ACTN|nr:hypothetical protein [Streptomyces populi]PKT67863.1 hypothetical protein CW362_38150 [Streptomyces populi]
MGESGEWKILADGGGSDAVVLAVDFDTTGRPEARFSDLVANLTTDLAVWESIPPAAEAAAEWSGKQYIDHWARAVEQERPRVHAVMGYCAGSVFAATLAERVAELQGSDPLLLLFDPEITVAQTLLWQFHKIVGFMSSVLPAHDIEAAREAGRRCYDTSPQVGPLKQGLTRLVREVGEPAFTRAGLDRTRREELFEAFGSFMGYLAAAGDLDPFERWRSATAISSSSPASGLNGIRAAGVGADRISVGRELTFDVEHATMLADQKIAATVSDLLRP